MAIEIREIIIKTEIRAGERKPAEANAKQLAALKSQVLAECKRIIAEKMEKRTYKR